MIAVFVLFFLFFFGGAEFPASLFSVLNMVFKIFFRNIGYFLPIGGLIFGNT